MNLISENNEWFDYDIIFMKIMLPLKKRHKIVFQGWTLIKQKQAHFFQFWLDFDLLMRDEIDYSFEHPTCKRFPEDMLASYLKR